MKMLAVTLALIAATASLPAAAQTLSDNRSGGDYALWDFSNIFTKANACGCDPSFSAAVVDSFTLSSRSRLSGVAADLVAFDWNYLPPTFKSFGDVANYRVDIFSTAEKAGQSLVGDIYSRSLTANRVAFSPLNGFAVPDVYPVTSIAATVTATLPVNLKLDAGTYWLAVTAINDPDDNGTIGVGLSGDSGAVWANPAGGWQLGPSNLVPENARAGYAVIGAAVPEASTWAMMICGFGAVGTSMRRKSRRRTAIA